MQNHMFRVPDGLLCRHGWSPSHSHLLAFLTVVSPWWPWLPNRVGQTKCGIWSNGGLVRMTYFFCRTGCQQFSWNRWYTLWTYLQWTQKPGGWKIHAQLLVPSQHTPVSFPIRALSRERWDPFGGRRGRSGRKTLMSKKASYPLHQKLLALTSSLTSSSLLADRSWNTSSWSGCSRGTVETPGAVSAKSSAVRSPTYLIVTQTGYTTFVADHGVVHRKGGATSTFWAHIENWPTITKAECVSKRPLGQAEAMFLNR